MCMDYIIYMPHLLAQTDLSLSQGKSGHMSFLFRTLPDFSCDDSLWEASFFCYTSSLL